MDDVSFLFIIIGVNKSAILNKENNNINLKIDKANTASPYSETKNIFANKSSNKYVKTLDVALKKEEYNKLFFSFI